ncbi:MAG: hypothetical protein JNM43_22480 [Planctomycetaceae bacterium]|nr:hypothetical protein [Planctomycetaceae bacterium]
MGHQTVGIWKRGVVVLLSLIVIVSGWFYLPVLLEKKGVGYVNVRFIVETHSVPAARKIVIIDEITESRWYSSVNNFEATIDVQAMAVSSESIWRTRSTIELSRYSVGLLNDVN